MSQVYVALHIMSGKADISGRYILRFMFWVDNKAARSQVHMPGFIFWIEKQVLATGYGASTCCV